MFWLPHKRQGISSLAEQLLASQGLWSMKCDAGCHKHIVSTTQGHPVDMQQDTALKVPAHFCCFSETITTVFIYIQYFQVTNFISYIWFSYSQRFTNTINFSNLVWQSWSFEKNNYSWLFNSTNPFWKADYLMLVWNRKKKRQRSSDTSYEGSKHRVQEVCTSITTLIHQ
jgi:hypothetical protein